MGAGKSRQTNPPEGTRMDTVTRARLKRKKQGPWEAGVSYGGEADLHKHRVCCVKNPGHQKFVPVDQFNMDHLPPGCRDKDLVDLVRAMSDLTVRVSVKYVSEGRPETVPGSDKPYPSYWLSGSNMMRTGTGWLWLVHKYPNKDDSSTTCECQECLDSITPKTQFAKIHMHTAVHVVYDELEAADTTCHLFFDKDDSPGDCSGVRALSGWAFMGRGESSDWCHMVHVTHDLDLIDRLDKMVDHSRNVWEKVKDMFRQLKSGEQESLSSWQYDHKFLEEVTNKYRRLESGEQKSLSPIQYLPEFWEKILKKYRPLKLMSRKRESSSPSEYLPEIWEKVTIIVSHPHGCSKQISVGYWTVRDVRNGHPTMVSYTTATCPGSSGAPVIMMGDAGLGSSIIEQIHCGNCEDDTNLNFSTYVLAIQL